MSLDIDFSKFGDDLGEELVELVKVQLEDAKEVGVELAKELKDYGVRIASAYKLAVMGSDSELVLEMIDDLQGAAEGVIVQAELIGSRKLKETLKGALDILAKTAAVFVKALIV